MIEYDYLNVEATVSFIKSCGTPKVENISSEQADYIFLSIQHSPDQAVLPEYIRVIKQMINDSLLRVDAFALMQDKILVNDGEPQWYGSQFDGKGKLIEVDNLDSVKVRRLRLGMETLEEYMKKSNSTY